VEASTIRQSIRPRFWYVAISNCGGGSLAGIRVRGSFLNNINSEEINWEFGVNQQGLQIMYLLFVIVYSLYIPFNGFVVYSLSRESGGVHAFVKIFCVITLVQFFAVILYFSHFWAFRADGVGHVGAYYVAQGVELVARVFFVMLLMFMADGWTIRTVGLEARSKMSILVALGLVTIVSLCRLMWAYFAITPEMVRPVLVQRVFTYLLLSFWVVFGIWFMRTCHASYMDLVKQTTTSNDENIEAKKRLFLVLGATFGIWILSLPITTYIALLLSPWVYDIVVQSVNISVTTLGFICFTVIIWPSWSKKYFQPPTRGVSIGNTDYNRL
jgi:hypothetical protein